VAESTEEYKKMLRENESTMLNSFHGQSEIREGRSGIFEDEDIQDSSEYIKPENVTGEGVKEACKF